MKVIIENVNDWLKLARTRTQALTDQEELGRGKRKRKEKNSKSNSSHLEDTADSESEDSSRTFKRPIIPTPPPSLQICQPGTH